VIKTADSDPLYELEQVFGAHTAVKPRFKRGIQKSVPLVCAHRARHGLLDRPVKPGDDARRKRRAPSPIFASTIRRAQRQFVNPNQAARFAAT
jgi:hypothetical protein